MGEMQRSVKDIAEQKVVSCDVLIEESAYARLISLRLMVSVKCSYLSLEWTRCGGDDQGG